MQPKFLIVDDDPQALELLDTILTSLEATVERADSGARALEILHDQKRASEFEAVFVDLIMPNLTGFAVISAIRKNAATAKLPIIALTAQDQRETLLEAYSLGADYFITKPFTREQVSYGFDLIFGQEEAKEAQKAHFTNYDV
jgi:CheY-like chemotaxis protein